MKDERYRQYWNESNGVSYIPWEYVETPKDLVAIQEGGWVDPATLPTGLEEVPVSEELDEKGWFVSNDIKLDAITVYFLQRKTT